MPPACLKTQEADRPFVRDESTQIPRAPGFRTRHRVHMLERTTMSAALGHHGRGSWALLFSLDNVRDLRKSLAPIRVDRLGGRLIIGYVGNSGKLVRFSKLY